MSRVTSKLQVTLPKAIAARFDIRPGDEVQFVPAGDIIRLEPGTAKRALDVKARLASFDQATERHRESSQPALPVTADRGWTREELYNRGRPR
ncbi:MAG: hypothetical protein A2V77_09690 [Anaeromyxobacter sp. RBG_16_69_14]|nr:MAG: hypothetical protein A2V77_09690 [Anaeromyxobacter sp. RBG_16_69_14]